MYIHLFVVVDTPFHLFQLHHRPLYLPLFVIVDTPRLAQLHAVSTLICNSRYTIERSNQALSLAVSTLICNSRYTMSYLSFSVSIKYGSSWVNKIPTLRLYSQPEYVVFTFLLSL